MSKKWIDYLCEGTKICLLGSLFVIIRHAFWCQMVIHVKDFFYPNDTLMSILGSPKNIRMLLSAIYSHIFTVCIQNILFRLE